MSEHVASVGTQDHEVRIYQVEHRNTWGPGSLTGITYYWCCENDGACSRHVNTIEDATAGAFQHTEEHNG